MAASSWAILLPGPWPKTWWVAACWLGACLAYRRTCAMAANYCDRMEGIIVAHRKLFFEAAGFDPPTSTADERARGLALSGYLDRDEVPFLRIGWNPPAAR